MGTLEIKRSENGYADSTRPYTICIDGVVIGDIKKGEAKSFPLSDGFHSLQLKIDWCTSRVENFTIENGQTIYAECAPGKKAGSLSSVILQT